MEVVFVKASGAGARDRTLLVDQAGARQVAVHVVHDLPHLVVESLFDLRDGLWGELATGRHAEANRAAGARAPAQQKRGRIVSGAASGASTGEWLGAGHRLAKAVTNAVVNRWGDGPDTAAGVRARLSGQALPGVRELLDRLDDETIELAITGTRYVQELWQKTGPGASLRLAWPLPAACLGGGSGEDR